MKENLRGIEFMVGIPSYMESDSISYVVKQVDEGLSKYFNKYKTVIVNVDNNSEDDTRGAFLNTETTTPKHYITTPGEVRGKGNNFLNLFKFGNKHLDTLKGAVVVDADLKSITPEWIKHLGEPILKGYDYVLPRYSRHQFDGTITNHICYPLLYGLLGEDIRQPIGGEFGFSKNLMKYWLDQKWIHTTKQYGIDIFMTMHAILGGFKIVEAGLGAKIHKASAPKLGPMFTQVVTTLFDTILAEEKRWLGYPIVNPKKKKLFGLGKLDPPQELKINIREMKNKLREEYAPREKILKRYLNDYAIFTLDKMFETDHYELDLFNWTQAVYQLLHRYSMGSPKIKKDVVESLKPLYFARSVTFDYMTWRYNVQYAEEAILSQAKAFASQKPYFLGLYLHEAMKHINSLNNK